MIPIAKPMIGPREIEAASAVLTSGMLAAGHKNLEFEEAWAKHTGSPYVIAVMNGTTALEAAIASMPRVDGQDEIITTPFTFNATVSAIINNGYKPMFVDIDPVTYNMDPSIVERAISGRTRAILPVHLYGLMADMPALRVFQKTIIEDAAQAHDSMIGQDRPGSHSFAATYSFYATKNITTGGEGGAVTTRNANAAISIRRLREHGSTKKYIHNVVGHNWRMTEMQAAVGLVQLKRLPSLQSDRWSNARILTSGLQGHIRIPHVPDGYAHSWHQYVVRHPDRDKIAALLLDRRIQTAVHYPTPDHMQPYWGAPGSGLPHAEKASREVLSLPVGPWLSYNDLDKIIETVKDALK